MQKSLTALFRAALPAFAVLALGACDSGPPLTGALAELDFDTTSVDPTEAGNYIRTVEEGSGEPAQDGDLMLILYSGWLTDGTLFDSSYNNDPPRPFPVVAGQGGAIGGFLEATAGLRAGEKRQVVIPPEQGYGEQGTPGGPIPPNSWLVFEVEAQEIREPADPSDAEFAAELNVDLSTMEQTDSGLYWTALAQGTGEPTSEGSEMALHYTGWLADGQKFDSSYDAQPEATPLSMVLGQTQLIQGWVEGVTGMRLGERRQLVIPPELGYGWRGSQGGIPGDAVLVFEVELVEHTPGG